MRSFALALALAVAFSAVAPHAPVAEHTDSPAGVDVDRSAQHPRDPIHLEPSRLEHHPACAACLLQLQSGSPLPGPASLPVPALGATFRLAAERTSPRRTLSLVPARAPPASSFSL